MKGVARESSGAPVRGSIRELGRMNWREVDVEPRPFLIVPVGSLEQHGPHLPLATDSIIAEALARRLCAARSVTVLAPTLAVTASGEHQGFAGTLSIGTDATSTSLIELIRSADWSAGVVLVNAHGGNAAALASANRLMVTEGRRVLVWWPTVPGGDLHAGETETSLMLAIAPDLVHMDQAVDGPSPSLAELHLHGVAALSPSGVLGNARRANVVYGDRLLNHLSDDLLSAFDRWQLA